MNRTEKCPLCHHQAESFYEDYFCCKECKAVFLSRFKLPSISEEKARYETHNNDVEDERYQQFVSPITDSVLRDYAPEHKGLDFGAGTGPVISKVLREKGYDLKIFDPFFHYNPEYLKAKYDFVVCCEVVEHFYHPDEEFKLLAYLSKPRGRIYIMTQIYDQNIEFKNWYYKNDPTHVFFYQRETFAWIREHYPFSSLKIEKRLVTLQRD